MSESEINPKDPEVRLNRLIDPSSLVLLSPRDDSGMLAAHGKIDGTEVALFSTDATIQGGAMGQAGCEVILAAYEYALNAKCPVIGLWHSGGARLREGVASLDAFGRVFAIMTRASGKIPQIS
ncbi:MAG: acyl-CoA carboxylase subunit beta, partial [Actinobacteria bacterium]|nr:acyl-CoA carboxylase subunit beta [Actinomycetota bacterium]